MLLCLEFGCLIGWYLDSPCVTGDNVSQSHSQSPHLLCELSCLPDITQKTRMRLSLPTHLSESLSVYLVVMPRHSSQRHETYDEYLPFWRRVLDPDKHALSH